MHCQIPDCPDLVHRPVKSLQLQSLGSIVKYVNELKELKLNKAIEEYLLHVLINSRGSGNFPVGFIFMQHYRHSTLANPFDISEECLTPISDSMIRASDDTKSHIAVCDKMRNAAGLAGEPCIFRFIYQGFCNMLLKCLINQETRAAKLLSDKDISSKYCTRHQCESKIKTADIVLSNEFVFHGFNREYPATFFLTSFPRFSENF